MQQAPGASNDTQLPRAVLRRSEAINARIKARNEARQPESAVPAAPTVDPTSAPNDPTPPGSVAAPPATPPASPEPPADPRENDPVYWRHRYKTVEGVLRVERQQRQDEQDRHHQEVTQLQEQIRSLQAQQPAPAPDLTKLFTPEQIEKFGADQLATVATAAQKAARDEAQALIQAAVKPLQEERKARTEQTEADRQAAYLGKLAELVPNYAEIDASDEWKLWLAQVDDDTEEQRQETLMRYHRAMNARQVAKIFKRFEQESAPAPVPAPPVTPHGGAVADGANAPRAASAALTVPTEAEVRDFYKRCATKKPGQNGYVTDAERKTFEKRLELKFAANRRRG